MRLESYEDALSNIELSDDGGMMASLLGDEYLIHYMVDLESRGSLLDIEAFSDPFAMGNCIASEDTNGNRKLLKMRREQKIDAVAAMMDAYIAYKHNREAFE